MAPTTIETTAAPTATKSKRAARTAPTGRSFWRAVVRTGVTFGAGRERDRVEWHLAGCGVPHGEGAHCGEGQRLLQTSGQPDGHCLIDGHCGRCGK